ncbi:FG-GAP-like repeat-containing protein [Novipirellula artificiosorum]|uniref:FG-GAP repeat protein n=1 Tax=Novipirellula artificiosorum TaxID=2528016 RepID=A0A5C6DET9_9BACT|nr:FG-GAP-like repeat-containing protein [Novipirellula artificiosorum]TWU34454.1 FG-GAP repeat protein [Novipirellula artificiosorum]
MQSPLALLCTLSLTVGLLCGGCSSEDAHSTAVDTSTSRSSVASRPDDRSLETPNSAVEPSDDAKIEKLTQALEKQGSNAAFHHELWRLLNRQGRRYEASLHADILTAAGQATLDESLSLIRRHLAYPPEPPITAADSMVASSLAQDEVEQGLAAALRYFSRRQYAAAQLALESEASAGFQSAAAEALYGRILGESSKFDAIPAWLLNSDKASRAEPNFWAAVGIWLASEQEHKAAIGATLEAIRRNPTDRVSYQRIAAWFRSIGEMEEGEQFWHRGLLLSEAEILSELDNPGFDLSAHADQQRQLAMRILKLGRPLESLQWTLRSLSTANVAQRRQVLEQMNDLRMRQDLQQTLTEHHFIALNPNDFPYQPAITARLREALVRSKSPQQQTDPISKSQDDAPLAKQINPVLDEVAAKVGLLFTLLPKDPEDDSPLRMHEALGSGLAVIDYDLDGRPDVYFGQAGCSPPDLETDHSNVLFRNLGNQFVATTEMAGVIDTGYACGIAAGDVNQDGFADLFVGNLGVNRLYINNGDGSFSERTERIGSQRASYYDRLVEKLGQQPYLEGLYTMSVAIADVDGDGLPDLFESNYVELDDIFVRAKPDREGRVFQKTPRMCFAESDRVFLQQPGGTFKGQAIDPAVGTPASSLGVFITDFDSRGGNEVFVGNDARPNHLLRRSKDGQWSNLADLLGIANSCEGVSSACMGITGGDFDRNGTLDLFICNFAIEPASFYLQNPMGTFTDQPARFGLDVLTRSLLGFGCKAIDLDRDGWLDLVLTNGHIDNLRDGPYEMPPQCLMRRGKTFEPVRPEATSDYWAGEYLGRAMVSLDYNQDKKLDLLVSHVSEPAVLLENQTISNENMLQFELVGTESERDAIGAIITVTFDGKQHKQWVIAGDGYLCTDEPVLEISLGDPANFESAQIDWPSGATQVFSEGLTLGHRYLIIEGEPPFLRF